MLSSGGRRRVGGPSGIIDNNVAGDVSVTGNDILATKLEEALGRLRLSDTVEGSLSILIILVVVRPVHLVVIVVPFRRQIQMFEGVGGLGRTGGRVESYSAKGVIFGLVPNKASMRW